MCRYAIRGCLLEIIINYHAPPPRLHLYSLVCPFSSPLIQPSLLYLPLTRKKSSSQPSISSVGAAITFVSISVFMENSTDAFGSSTAPLTWHDFLERMRQPSAAEFVKAIKRFLYLLELLK